MIDNIIRRLHNKYGDFWWTGCGDMGPTVPSGLGPPKMVLETPKNLGYTFTLLGVGIEPHIPNLVIFGGQGVEL